jgi:hypothetical protein
MRQTNSKKLRLERETVAVLQSVELTDIHGGILPTGCVSGCGQCPGDRPFTQGTQIGKPPIGQPPLSPDIFKNLQIGKPPVR